MKSSQCMYINVYEQFNWYFANYHATLTIANVISWNVAVWNFRLEKNEEKKVSKLTLSKLSIIFLVVQISARKTKNNKDKKNIRLYKDLFYVHSVHGFHI